jgi:hypothetical protein
MVKKISCPSKVICTKHLKWKEYNLFSHFIVPGPWHYKCWYLLGNLFIGSEYRYSGKKTNTSCHIWITKGTMSFCRNFALPPVLLECQRMRCYNNET